jgi:hypothetical protein
MPALRVLFRRDDNKRKRSQSSKFSPMGYVFSANSAGKKNKKVSLFTSTTETMGSQTELRDAGLEVVREEGDIDSKDTELRVIVTRERDVRDGNSV